MKKSYTLMLLIFLMSAKPGYVQIVINELSNMNRHTIYNEEDETDDWIELYNPGTSAVNLKGWSISDNPDDPEKWIFPEIIIPAQQYILLYASGKEPENELVHHWESVIYSYDTWKYFSGNSEPPSRWYDLGFNEAAWSSGQGGFGYGTDTCINTFISPGTNSIYQRINFPAINLSNIMRAVLHMDYIDGFVAYLNGVEIARSNMNQPRPEYNDFASYSNEALLHKGERLQAWYLDQNLLRTILKGGTNVLAIQVHKASPESNQLSSSAFFSLGIGNESYNYKEVTPWMNLGETYFHVNFKLAEKEEIVLSNSFGAVADTYIVPEIQTDHSTGRKTDGSFTKGVFKTPTPGSSNNASICFEGYEPPPHFSLNGGFYDEGQSLILKAQSGTSVIRYTLNGGIPDQMASIYINHLDISQTKVVAGRSFSTGNRLPSRVVKNTYFIKENSTLPVFSITTDSLNLWDHTKGIYVKGPNASSDHPYYGANFWQDWEKIGHIEFFDKEKVKQISIDAGIKIHGGHSRVWDQKSFRIHCRSTYGTPVMNYPFIEDKAHIKSYKRIVLRNGGSEFWHTRFRDGFIQRLVKSTQLDYIAYEPTLVFLNGSYWGLYDIRERIDKHYLVSNYNLSDKCEFDILEYHGRLKIKEGSPTHFYNTYDFIISGEASDPKFYENTDYLFDLKNFADFYIVQTFVSNYDWMLDDFTSNFKFWRPRTPGGRWRYFLIDVDFGFGLKNGTMPSDNTLSLARHPIDPNPHSDLFNKMLYNEEFKNYFVNRYADLMNTCLHINNIKAMVESFKNKLEPEIARHVERWKYPSDWYKSIEHLLWFAENRVHFARKHVQNEFNLNKQVEVSLAVYPENAGQIKISTIIPDSLPWKGVYFDGVPVTITALPNQGFNFKCWGINGLIPDQNPDTSITLHITSDETFTAYFEIEEKTERVHNLTFEVHTFPNPSKHNIIVNIFTEITNTGDISFEVYDLMGKKMNEQKLPGNNQIILKKEDYLKGIYLLKISSDESVIMKKVIFN